MALTKERFFQPDPNTPPLSKRYEARNKRASAPAVAEFWLEIACYNELVRSLGVQPPTGDLKDSHSHSTHLAEEISRWTDVRVSGKQLDEIWYTDLHDLIREAVRQRDDYLDKAIQDRRQRAEAIQRLNETDRAAASYIAQHPGCTGDTVAEAIDKSGEHFRRRIVPKLKPFGLLNYGGYYMPALSIV